MATRGYNSYRGPTRRRKGWLALLLVTVILAAAGLLLLQDYIVYGADGSIRLDVPLFRKQEAAVEDADVHLEIKEAEATAKTEPVSPNTTPAELGTATSAVLKKVSPIHAIQLTDRALLQQDPNDILAALAGDLVIPVKLINGSISYNTSAAIPTEVSRLRGESLENLQVLLDGKQYTAARMYCFCDSYFVHAESKAGLMKKNTGTWWYDADGRTWLDPANENVAAYIETLCCEYADLGFDEIILDDFCYPLTGNTEGIEEDASTDRVKVLTDFSLRLRRALPENVALSVVLRSDVTVEYGLDYDLLLNNFERIYCGAGADVNALLAAGGNSFESASRLVYLSTKAPDVGSYVLLP